MRYLSVCSGIEAATVAWHPLGWTPAAFSEIEAFPRAVLHHHYPDVPCHGDFTTIGADDYGPVDLLVGGTPCQSFSVAGLRGGLGDDRGNLALEYLRLADRKRPRWLVWENVPGVLSSHGGRDFGSILGGMVELGYGIAYRVLDAQFFGVPQRRRRVFVVGYLGDWRPAAAVLFERQSLSGHPAPRREKGQSAPTILSRSSAGGGLGTDFDCDGGLIEAFGGKQWPADVAPTLNAAFASKMGLEDQHALGGAGCFVPGTVGALTARGPGTYGAPEIDAGQVICVAHGQHNAAVGVDIAPTLSCLHEAPYIANALTSSPSAAACPNEDATLIPTYSQETADPVVCKEGATWTHEGTTFRTRNVVAVRTAQTGANGIGVAEEVAHTLDQAQGQAIAHSFEEAARWALDGVPRGQTSAVRRLTPRECERLQGFPDDYTLVPYRNKDAADGPRYKALGNSMAVPVMRWIGERIAMVEALIEQEKAA